MNKEHLPFPKDFIWGASTSAYQIEGAAETDGRGRSVWDEFCDRPGKIHDGQTGLVACDHYYRYREDVALMSELGLQGYRMSLSWPRILPSGTERVNEAGLDYYDRLIDELMAKNITPWVTLFHWDLPTALYYQGGWGNRAIADWFAEYCHVAVSRLGDRVKNWITLNEIQCFVELGHYIGVHAPGDKVSLAHLLQMIHHVFLAHGKGVQAIRAASKDDCQIGWAPVCHVCVPETDSEADIAAARKATFAIDGVRAFSHDTFLSWWVDAVHTGQYPQDGWKHFGDCVPQVEDGDLSIISTPCDFLGANIYRAQPVRANPSLESGYELLSHGAGHPENALGWKLNPEGMYWSCKFLHERYGLPIVITENGLPSVDFPGPDGRIDDGPRKNFIYQHLQQLYRAITDGVPVQGYFHWSFIDNFEWSLGYSPRFGLVYNDYATQKRIPKNSAYYYREIIKANALMLPV